MEKKRYINLNGIRQSYFIMYEEDNIRYIFNRSIRWNGLIQSKKIKKLINLLGENAILNFFNKIDNMNEDIIYLTNTFWLDTTKFQILAVRSDLPNYNREDQKECETIKKFLCEKYNAVKCQNDLPNGQRIDFEISKHMKEALKKWLIEIYNEIGNYAKLIKDEMVNSTLSITVDKIKNEISILKEKEQQMQNILVNLNKEINNNRQKLARQNYVIEKFYKQYDFNESERNYIENNSHGYML